MSQINVQMPVLTNLSLIQVQVPPIIPEAKQYPLSGLTSPGGYHQNIQVDKLYTPNTVSAQGTPAPPTANSTEKPHHFQKPSIHVIRDRIKQNVNQYRREEICSARKRVELSVKMGEAEQPEET